MDFPFSSTTWYSIVTIGSLVSLVLLISICLIFQWIASLVKHTIRKHIVYSTFNLFNLFEERLSVEEIIVVVLYVSANSICIGWRIKTADELSTRCASLLVTNSILLLPSASAAADVFRISLRSYQRIHCVVGLVALIEGSIHAIQELVKQEWKTSTLSVTGLAVSVSPALTSVIR